jgi:hypothetical protein
MTTEDGWDAAINTLEREFLRADTEVHAALLTRQDAALNYVSLAVRRRFPDAKRVLLTSDTEGTVGLAEVLNEANDILFRYDTGDPEVATYIEELPWDALLEDAAGEFWSATIELVDP